MLAGADADRDAGWERDAMKKQRTTAELEKYIYELETFICINLREIMLPMQRFIDRWSAGIRDRDINDAEEFLAGFKKRKKKAARK
jgi:hypothetical protein